MSFRIGQKVVCVDDMPRRRIGTYWDYLLKKGDIYTIRWAGIYGTRIQPDSYCVLLAGISREDDVPFGAHRFRPLIERKTDISVFTKLLREKKEVG